MNDFKLPWLTQDGREVMISWSSFPIKNSDGVVDGMSLVGKLFVSTDEDTKEPLVEHITPEVEYEEEKHQSNKRKKHKVLFKIGRKKILFRKSKSAGSSDTFDDIKVKISPKKEKGQKPVEHKPKKTIEPRRDENLTMSSVDVNTIIRELERKNKKLEKENKRLEQNLKSLKTRLARTKEKQQKSDKEQELPFNRWLYVFFDSIGGKKKKEELDQMMQELDERRNLLDNLETQLINEKKNLNMRRDEFCNWRERLEVLEEEVEKRREEIVRQEKTFKDRIIFSDGQIHPSSFPELSSTVSDVDELDEEAKEDYHDVLDRIPGCAAVIQRSMLKQINRSFAELLGYALDEVVGKSLFDFIVPEGFVEIERYYLGRLKGVSSSSYETVFLTKDNEKIAVSVSTRPTRFNGEKAEIAVFNKVTDTQEGAAAIEDVEDKQEETADDDKVEDRQEEESPNNKLEDESKDSAPSETADRSEDASNSDKEKKAKQE